jgi:hypothetical protein
MANPNRGEVELKAGDKTYTLAFTINSVCELETMLDKSVGEVVADMGRVSVVRAVLWAGLRHHHKVDLEQAGQIMHEAGAAVTAQAINQALAMAFPQPEAGAKAKNR